MTDRERLENMNSMEQAERIEELELEISDWRGEELASRNSHPTVKPTELMAWLVNLVTPPGGTVLDPFVGSGSTLVAAKREGFGFIGIEREPEYVEIIEVRTGEVAN